MGKNRFVVSIIFCTLFFFLFNLPIRAATSYGLIAPTGTLTQGQDVTFTVTIDTQGATLTTAEIGMTYDTQYLQYVSVVPGNTFTTVTATNTETGKLVITGSSASGYAGSGNYALVNFKLIAQSPGSTEICTLWAPSPTTPATTSVPPTALPQTGDETPMVKYGLLGALSITIAAGLFTIRKFKNNTF